MIAPLSVPEEPRFQFRGKVTVSLIGEDTGRFADNCLAVVVELERRLLPNAGIALAASQGDLVHPW